MNSRTRNDSRFCFWERLEFGLVWSLAEFPRSIYATVTRFALSALPLKKTRKTTESRGASTIRIASCVGRFSRSQERVKRKKGGMPRPCCIVIYALSTRYHILYVIPITDYAIVIRSRIVYSLQRRS